LEIICPTKDPQGGALTEIENNTNRLIDIERKDIEGLFGTLVRKFKSLTMYNKALDTFDTHLRNCCALYNYDTFIANEDTDLEATGSEYHRYDLNIPLVEPVVATNITHRLNILRARVAGVPIVSMPSESSLSNHPPDFDNLAYIEHENRGEKETDSFLYFTTK